MSNSSGIFGDPFERIFGTGKYELAGFGEPASVSKCAKGYPIFVLASTVFAKAWARQSKTNKHRTSLRDLGALCEGGWHSDSRSGLRLSAKCDNISRR